MKKWFFIIIVISFCSFYCMAQKTYLAGVYNTPINVTCEEFRKNISHESQYLGEYYIADFEESPRVYNERADTYVTNDIWGHGRTHVYVQCKEGRVKLVYMEFQWGDASKRGSDSFATYTWGQAGYSQKYMDHQTMKIKDGITVFRLLDID